MFANAYDAEGTKYELGQQPEGNAYLPFSSSGNQMYFGFNRYVAPLPADKEIVKIEIGMHLLTEDVGMGADASVFFANDIKLVENKEVINLRGTVIPLIRLTEVLDVESTRSPEDNLIVVIVKKGDKMAGLVIDELIGQQEIVIKSLGKYIKQCKFISGATILGDGEVALILDANALL